MSQSLPALRILIRGEVTSFRYPHFTQGFQPTYDMPPPSTIYGHVISALGRHLLPDELQQLQFGYTFRHEGRFIDYMEHLHFDDPIQPFPFNRELLFRPHLTLYLTGERALLRAIHDAFVQPTYIAVLGRSQDLVTIEDVAYVTLESATQGYFEYTLLPHWMAPRLTKNVIVVTMSRFIDRNRHPAWESYALLRDTAPWPPQMASTFDETTSLFQFPVDDVSVWVDPASPAYRGDPAWRRAVWLHRFIDDTGVVT